MGLSTKASMLALLPCTCGRSDVTVFLQRVDCTGCPVADYPFLSERPCAPSSGCRRRTSARLWFDRQQSACFSSDSRYVLCRCSSHSCLCFFMCDSPLLSRHSTRAVSVLISVAPLFPGAETFRAVQVTLILRRSVWIDCRLQENGGYECVLPQWCTFPFR